MANELVETVRGTDLALPDMTGAEFTSPEMFNELVKAGFMARVQLCGGSSGLVIESKMRVGCFAFVRGKDDFIDFGDNFNFVPFSYRFAAMRFGDDEFKVYYNPNSPEFKQVQIDSQETDSKCSYGPQFLIWVPQVKDYATFLFGSKSARPEARKMATQMNKPSTMRSKLVSNKGNKWHVPVVIPFSGRLELPDVDAAKAVAMRFNKPSEEETFSEVDTSAPAVETSDSNERKR